MTFTGLAAQLAALASQAADPTTPLGIALDGIFGTAPASHGTNDVGTVLIVGDSIAAGEGAASAAAAFPALIPAALERYGLTGATVVSGVGGNLTSDQLARLPGLLTTYAPSEVLFMATVNDSRADRAVTTAMTVANIRAAAHLSRLAGARFTVVNSAPINPVWFNNPANTLASARKAVDTNAAVAALCTELGVTLIDVYSAFFGTIGLSYDGIHPNDAGHALWADTIAAGYAVRTARPALRTLFADGFARADSTASLGSPWTAWVGTWGIAANRAYSVSAADGDIAVVNAGSPDVAVHATIGGTSLHALGAIARGANASNHYFAGISVGARALTIFKCVGGTYTAIATATGLPVTVPGDVFTFVVDGSHLMCYVNRYPYAAIEDSTFATGNYAGIRNSNAVSDVYDAFKVTA